MIKKKKILFVLYLSVNLAFSNFTFAVHQLDESSESKILSRKPSQYRFNLANDFLQLLKPKHKGKKGESLIENNQNQKKGILVQLYIPQNIAYSICYDLVPLDIVHLSMVNKYFNKIIKNDFWEKYAKIYGYRKWNDLLPWNKVIFANIWLERGTRELSYIYLKKSAMLGHPEALKSLKAKRNKKKGIPVLRKLEEGFIQAVAEIHGIDTSTLPSLQKTTISTYGEFTKYLNVP